jgi:hypothetical protein
MKATVAIALLLAGAAQAQTIGLHLVSAHVPARSYQQNFNPGLYVRTENGIVAGFYRNTLNRTSVYVGLAAEGGPFSLTIGLISGYQTKWIPGPCPDPSMDKGNGCLNEYGSKAYLQPFLSPSVRLPAVAGITPRFSYVPGIAHRSTNVFHLSLEKEF